jgi:hypothetical protein
MTIPIDQTGLATPTLLYSAISPTVTVGSVATDSSFGTSPLKTEDGFNDEPPKKKQKRNKPTLSCEECVERKTKVSQSSTNLSHANLAFGEMGIIKFDKRRSHTFLTLRPWAHSRNGFCKVLLIVVYIFWLRCRVTHPPRVETALPLCYSFRLLGYTMLNWLANIFFRLLKYFNLLAGCLCSS